MTLPGHNPPRQPPDDQDFLELRERVNHLAVEVFHLTTEVEELRRRVGSEGLIPSDSEHVRPKEDPVPLLPRFDVGPSTESVEFDLDCFLPERPQSAPPANDVGEHDVHSHELAGEPTTEASTLGVPQLPPESPRFPRMRTAARFGGAVGLGILLLVGLVRGGDHSDLVTTVTPAATLVVGPFEDVPAPNSVAQVQSQEHLDSQTEEPNQSRSVPYEAPSIQVAEVDSSSRLSVLRSAVGSDVIERELVGRSDIFRVGTPVVFWTHIGRGHQGDTIRHVWSHDGGEVSVAVLPVNGPSWRTQSRHTLVPGSEGDWVVEVQDSDGRTLVRHRFRCEAANQNSPRFPTSIEASTRRE